MDTAAASQNRMFPASTFWKTQERRAVDMILVKDEKKGMKSESIVGQSPCGRCNEIDTVLANVSVVTRVEDTEAVQS